MKILRSTVMLATLLAAGGSALAASSGNPLVDEVRDANNRFKDVSVAVTEGYKPIACASGIEDGSMGIHYVSEARLKDDGINLAQPEAVMYEPSSDGKLALIGVEYITTKGPAELNGHLFNFNNAPNRYGLPAFYELHVWAWKKNRKGAFTDMNPDVSCDPVAK
jgi:hypothetical protein